VRIRSTCAGLLLAAITLPGCATVAHGGKQKILVTSVPTGADVFIGAEMVGKTPAWIAVPRKDTAIVLRLERSDHAPAEIPLRRATDRWVAGGAVWGAAQLANQGHSSTTRAVITGLGIVIGTAAIDHLTGAAYVQKPEQVHVVLLPNDKTAHAKSIEVTVPGPAGSLAGTLTLPARGRPPYPAVVTLTGSGAHHRDGNRTLEHPYRPFRDIADALAGCGVATLRLDDRGVGGSTGNANAAGAEDTAADAQSTLRFLRARADVDARRIALIGHSYGGIVAPMVAADDPTLAALVLLGAPARPFRETMRYQHAYRIANDHAIAAASREAALDQAMREQEANVATSAEAWRRSIQDRDPLPAARRLRMPVLILHGLNDRAVDPADAEMLEQAIRGAGNPRVQRVVFPGVNHHFQRDAVGAREGYDRLPEQVLAPEVLSALCSWLQATLR
jgi:dienelactone hydrolase